VPNPGGRVPDEKQAMDELASDERHLRRIGTADEFPPGACRLLTVGDHEVGVYNIEGNFYGIRNHCPHMGAPVCKGNVGGTMLPSGVGEYVYGLEGKVVHCPWHQWAFDIPSGRALFGIDRSRLITHTVIRKGDDLFLDERIRKASEIDADELNAESSTDDRTESRVPRAATAR
jgi:nitrite reductase (NADH) small subunit